MTVDLAGVACTPALPSLPQHQQKALRGDLAGGVCTPPDYVAKRLLTAATAVAR